METMEVSLRGVSVTATGETFEPCKRSMEPVDTVTLGAVAVDTVILFRTTTPSLNAAVDDGVLDWACRVVTVTVDSFEGSSCGSGAFGDIRCCCGDRVIRGPKVGCCCLGNNTSGLGTIMVRLEGNVDKGWAVEGAAECDITVDSCCCGATTVVVFEEQCSEVVVVGDRLATLVAVVAMVVIDGVVAMVGCCPDATITDTTEFSCAGDKAVTVGGVREAIFLGSTMTF